MDDPSSKRDASRRASLRALSGELELCEMQRRRWGDRAKRNDGAGRLGASPRGRRLARSVLLRSVAAMHGDEYIVLRGSKERDPDGKKVGAAIRAHLALERARRLRELFVHGVAAASILVWPLAAWRRLDSAPFRGLTLAFWAVTFIALVTTSIEEHRCHRRLSRLVADLRGPAQGD